MRRHPFIGGFLIVLGLYCWIPIGNNNVRDYGFFHSTAFIAYIVAGIHILGGIRLLTGMRLFRFSDFRREKRNATVSKWSS